MISTKDAQIISNLFYLLDTNVRNDLHHDRISDERDCVSRMVTHFNYPFGVFNQFLFNHIKFQSKWFSKVNSGHHERKFGCDSMLVFKLNNKIKVGLFEAKWPRVIKDPSYQWDYTQKSTKTSHFTNQIERQANWTNQVAIWEMFFYEEKVGVFNSPFDKNASTCIKHQFAQKLVNTTPSLQTIWNNSDLTSLIKSEQTTAFDGTNETNLKTIIFDILTCTFGKPILIKPDDRNFTLTSNNQEERARCPIIAMTIDDDNLPQAIEGFMTENGLSFFQQVDIILPVESKVAE
jgi:hypothetical protein